MNVDHVRRCVVVGLTALVLAQLGTVPAEAVATIPGGLGGEILGNPVPGPVLGPNVFPVPPPVVREPGFVPAPPAPPAPPVFPIPGPGVAVQDGPGSGPPDAPPIRIDADTPAAGKNEPVGKLSLVDDKFLKRRGVDAHEEKRDAGLVPESRFDIYIDQNGTMFGVRKGDDPRFGEFLGPLPG